MTRHYCDICKQHVTSNEECFDIFYRPKIKTFTICRSCAYPFIEVLYQEQLIELGRDFIVKTQAANGSTG